MAPGAKSVNLGLLFFGFVRICCHGGTRAVLQRRREEVAAWSEPHTATVRLDPEKTALPNDKLLAAASQSLQTGQKLRAHDSDSRGYFFGNAVSKLVALGPHCSRASKDHINIRILQTMISGIHLHGALDPECKILRFMWSLGPLCRQPMQIRPRSAKRQRSLARVT